MGKIFVFCLMMCCLPLVVNSQIKETIPLEYDTSGYSTTNLSAANKISNANPPVMAMSLDTIPTIKSEMNVNDSGALTYMIPIEVLKGQGNFQPNIALAYSSQSGNGQAGWGWNIIGLSTISRGGKSKLVDGITIGAQFNNDDPFYLDGQRLLATSATTFETEKFSKIKITKINTSGFSFMIQYTDGKVAKYSELVAGQHYIKVIKDALNNELHYSYSVINNVPSLTSISYGGTSYSNDKFFVEFHYTDRAVNTKSYRNGVLYKNTKVLSDISVRSVYITTNAGLYRMYKLVYDYIQSNTVERLIRVEVENGTGQSLKPLRFIYNPSHTGTIVKHTGYSAGIPHNAVGLGNVAMGDFYRTGQLGPIYEIKRADSTYVYTTERGTQCIPYTKSREYFGGRSLQNNKMCENDQLISAATEYIGEVDPLTLNNTASLIDRIEFKFTDFVNGFTKSLTMDLVGGAIQLDPTFHTTFDNMFDWPLVSTTTLVAGEYIRNQKGREIISGDYNNDGLVDVIIFEKSDLLRPQKFYFAELGSAVGGQITPVLLSCPEIDNESRVYQIEFDGDGLPELMFVSKDGVYSIFRVNLLTNALVPITNQQNIELTNYHEKMPLIFGDYNGDGLTDFITPQKVYDIQGSSVAKELNKMESEPLLWWEYIATGIGFIKTERDYTEQKIAYLAPSQRNIIKRSSFWSKVWSGTPDSYSYTEYGSSTVFPMDINNDGKTDLVSFSKCGRAKYDEDGKLYNTRVENLNTFSFTPQSAYVPDRCVDNYTGAVSNPSTLSWGSPCNSFSTFEPAHWVHYPQVIVNSTIANKILFHINTTLPDGQHSMVNLPTVISLNEDKISPLSLAINNADFNQLSTYKTRLTLYDPITHNNIGFTANNDEFVEGQLNEIDNGSHISQVIEYRPMVEKNITNLEKVYATDYLSLPYPYYVHKNIGINYLVHKMHTVFDGKILTKEYRYMNGIQHMWGKGFIGFQKTMVSDPYESIFINGKYQIKDMFKGLFWSVKTYDPLNDNALISATYGSLNPNSVFTKSTITNQRFDKGTNRYLILATLEQNIDYLQGITINKSYQYDTIGDLTLQQVNTDYNSQASNTQKFFYTPENFNGNHYFFGKHSRIENTSIKDAATYSTKSEQDYNSDGTLLQSRKYGNNTLPIVTDYTYNSFGEVSSQTLSTNGIAPVTTTFEYDVTNRYLWKVTAPDGLVATTNFSSIGWLTSEINVLGLTTSYKYDRWGTAKEITDYLGKKTTIHKMLDSSAPAGSYIISKKREGGVETRVLMDKFNREVKSMTQTLNSQWVNVSTEYDIFGKKTGVSEPYFNSEIPLWNYTEYDEINRPIKNISFTGKIFTTCYEKMKVSIDDGFKKTEKWLDANGNTIKHKDSGGEIFYKYYPDGSLKETDYAGIKTKIEIDGWGNKIKLTDPSAGIYLYEYDNLSRIKKETNPKGGITIYTYDDLGRAISENTTSTAENTIIVKNFGYDPTTHLPTTISGTYNEKNYTYTTFYNDPYHRATGKKEETPDFTYETTTTFDDFGRINSNKLKTTLISPNYSTESNILNNYDNNGILTSQIDLDNSQTIWTVNNINSHGLTTQVTYGNGYVVNSTYNSSTLSLEKIRHQKDSSTIVDIDYTYNIQRGVLINRNNHVFNKNEDFDYDDLNRLLEEKVNGSVTQYYTYDKRGRMTSNTAVGKYNYADTDYKLESINYNNNGSQLNAQRGFADIQYNSFKNPNEIFLSGKDRISYDYSILKNRSCAYYGSLSTTATDRPNRKFFSSDKAIEIVKEGVVTKIITYITGDPYNANYIKIDQLTGSNVDSINRYFLHRDNQSTIVAITTADASATVVEQRYFDAWGNLKNAVVAGLPQTPNTLGWVNNLLIDRGYTGHEYLKTVGLIHMNGRLYDPQLKRFLSPDNYLQDSYNTQNYNRYGYVLNNPLLYTDPSGEELTLLGAFLYGCAIAITMNAIENMINGIPFWYGMGKAGVIGGITGVISFGIGQMATDLFGHFVTTGKALFEAGMHGIVGGTMSDLEGGSFASGLAAGAVSSLVSSGIESLGAGSTQITSNAEAASANGYGLARITTFASRNPDLYKAIMITSGGVSGGLSSAIAGGDFMDGMRQGLITSGLNHLGSEWQRVIAEKRLIKEVKDACFSITYDRASKSIAMLEYMAENIPTLKRAYIAAGRPLMEINYKDMYWWKDNMTEALTFETGNKNSSITFFGASFRNHVVLAQNMLHEFGHAIFNQLGYRSATRLKYGEITSYHGSEVYATEFAYKYGGVSIEGNSAYTIGLQMLGNLIKTDSRFTNY